MAYLVGLVTQILSLGFRQTVSVRHTSLSRSPGNTRSMSRLTRAYGGKRDPELATELPDSRCRTLTPAILRPSLGSSRPAIRPHRSIQVRRPCDSRGRLSTDLACKAMAAAASGLARPMIHTRRYRARRVVGRRSFTSRPGEPIQRESRFSHFDRSGHAR